MELHFPQKRIFDTFCWNVDIATSTGMRISIVVVVGSFENSEGSFFADNNGIQCFSVLHNRAYLQSDKTYNIWLFLFCEKMQFCFIAQRIFFEWRYLQKQMFDNFQETSILLFRRTSIADFYVSTFRVSLYAIFEPVFQRFR